MPPAFENSRKLYRLGTAGIGSTLIVPRPEEKENTDSKQSVSPLYNEHAGGDRFVRDDEDDVTASC